MIGSGSARGDLNSEFKLSLMNYILPLGAYWHKQRKLMNPMFSTTAIKGMYHLMVDELKELTTYLNEQNLRESININDILQKVALVRY